MKILLFGKNGLLGSAFLRRLSGETDFEMFALGSSDCDVTDELKVKEVVRAIKPNIIINCTAYTAVDDAESHPDDAFKLNEKAVKFMAESSKEVDAVLIHFSTDYVFNGKLADGYDENGVCDPLNVYGESKAAGERAILDSGCNSYIIRTSWLFGPDGKNFVKTMLELAKVKDELGIVSDQIGAPTYTQDLVESVVVNFLGPLMADVKQCHERDFECNYGKRDALEFGVYHITNSGFCSWYELAKKTFELKEVNIKLNKLSSEEFVRPAVRPACSVLKNTKLPDLRSWEDALKAYLELYF